jgi:DNA-binding GntR family transcriptional regulator
MEFDPTKSKWEQIAEDLKQKILSGHLPPRSLVSEVQMEAEYGVARTTVRKATAQLRKEGRITTSPGLGNFVADEPPGV